jgi:hypothetical protein
MDVTPRESWCSCEPANGGAAGNYPPKAGTGFAKKN